MELVNKTPFAAERALLHDKEGRDLLVVIMKCTYSLKNESELRPAEEQVPVQMADRYHGKPGESSVRYESDLVPHKTGTDVVMLGHACAGKSQATQVDVSLRVGTLSKTVRVFGDRCWKKSLVGTRPSALAPFDRLPLLYERAFGGRDPTGPEPEQDARNPVGHGFLARNSRQELDGLALPNLEDPANLIAHPTDRPEPVGFGFIGRHWQPRRALAGTYDDAWKEKRAPLLPADFSENYYSGAPHYLVAKPYLRGDEPVEIVNASRPSPLRFSLPGMRPRVRMLMGEDPFSVEMSLDTLLIEPDLERVVMVWRGAQDVHNRLDRVEGIEFSILT